MKRYESWGRYPKAVHTGIVPVSWTRDVLRFDDLREFVLPYGCGRSYGDTCLNHEGILLDTAPLGRLIAFDEEQGILRCEAGITLAEILEVIVSRGWFIPVTPGTKYVSVGGAIANDVHGKNHHRLGTFGCHVRQFELLRSTGERFLCSPTTNTDLFRATIGGLGLTGLVLWAELQLKRIDSPAIVMEHFPLTALEDFLEMTALSDKDFEYTVAWIDCLARGKAFGRGIFIRGNHVGAGQVPKEVKKPRTVRLPFNDPTFLLNRLTMRMFNHAYYRANSRRKVEDVIHYDSFFYPLDVVHNWNRFYGKRGFLQYQCVVPAQDDCRAVCEILKRIARSGKAPFLSILKVFGAISSPGMLSFPRPGVSLALDFPFEGAETLQLLEDFDEIVRANGGAVYPAKDARMSARSFQTYFPQWKEFAQLMDPKFSSSFWRRVAIHGDQQP